MTRLIQLLYHHANQDLTCRFCGARLDETLLFDSFHECLYCCECNSRLPHSDTTYRFSWIFVTNPYTPMLCHIHVEFIILKILSYKNNGKRWA